MSHQSVGIPVKDLSGDVLAIEQQTSMSIPMEELDPREDYPKPEPVEQTEKIQLGREKGRITSICSLLTHREKTEITHFLKENSNVFAWSAADMPSISHSVIHHSLNINPNAKPTRQKKKAIYTKMSINSKG